MHCIWCLISDVWNRLFYQWHFTIGGATQCNKTETNLSTAFTLCYKPFIMGTLNLRLSWTSFLFCHVIPGYYAMLYNWQTFSITFLLLFDIEFSNFLSLCPCSAVWGCWVGPFLFSHGAPEVSQASANHRQHEATQAQRTSFNDRRESGSHPAPGETSVRPTCTTNH